LIVLISQFLAGCAYLQTKDEPPPLPPIEEPRPPFTMKGDYFKAFPWDALPAPRKDENEPDTTTYTMKEGDTVESVAGRLMGDPGMASRLATYNNLPSAAATKVGDKLIVPYPVIGVSSEIMVKSKGEPEFGSPRPFGAEFKTGDQYKLRFETNVNGYCYVFRKGAKGIAVLYPAPAKTQPPKPKKGKKGKAVKEEPLPLVRDTSQVKAHEAIIIPIDQKGYLFDPKKAGDMIYVFLSLRTIPELEDLIANIVAKKSVRPEELEAVLARVKEGPIFREGPLQLLRVSDPKEILGFSFNIDG